MVGKRFRLPTEHELKQLGPAVEALRKLRMNCMPLDSTWNEIGNLIAGYQRLALKLTGHRFFYGGDPDKGQPRI